MGTVNWPGVRRVRDLGGLPLRSGGRTRSGALIRCGELDGLSPRGRRAVLAARPSRIIDLRSDHEITSASPMAGHVGYRHLPFIDPARDHERVPALEASRSDLYLGSLKRNGRNVATVFRDIATAGPGPVVVHCKSGVDRTGMLVAVLLQLVGVTSAAIVADYLTDTPVGSAPAAEAPRGVLAQPLTGETMVDVLSWLDERGGAAGYLAHHGVAAASLRALRTRLVGHEA